MRDDLELFTSRTPIWRRPITDADARRWAQQRKRGAIPPGARVRILDVHPEDSYAGADDGDDRRQELRGRFGYVGPWSLDPFLSEPGYMGGSIVLEKPLSDGSTRPCFYAVRVERVPHLPAMPDWTPDYDDPE